MKIVQELYFYYAGFKKKLRQQNGVLKKTRPWHVHWWKKEDKIK